MAIGLKKRRRVQLIVIGFVLMAVASALVGYGFRDGIEYFRSPSQVAKAAPPANETFRIGGLVKTGSVKKQGHTVDFIVTDGGADVPVHFSGILPDLFKEAKGVIATGKLVNGTFEAREILAKHDENYMPKEVIDALKKQGMYQPNGQ